MAELATFQPCAARMHDSAQQLYQEFNQACSLAERGLGNAVDQTDRALEKSREPLLQLQKETAALEEDRLQLQHRRDQAIQQMHRLRNEAEELRVHTSHDAVDPAMLKRFVAQTEELPAKLAELHAELERKRDEQQTWQLLCRDWAKWIGLTLEWDRHEDRKLHITWRKHVARQPQLQSTFTLTLRGSDADCYYEAADFVPPVDADRYSSLLAKLNESPKDNFGVFVRQMRGVLAKAAEA